MSVLAVDFKQSRSAEEQRQIRAIVRKIPRDKLTKGQRDILMVIVNQWFHHRYGPKGYIHPGRKLIAKKANVTVVTVARALDVLREAKVIEAIRYAKGGTFSTRYTVNLMALREVYDPSGVEEISGVLVPFQRQQGVTNDTVQNDWNDTVSPYQNDTRSITAYDLSQEDDDYLPIEESLIDYDEDFQ